MSFRFETIVNGPFAENCYLVWDDASRQGIFIDPGSDPERLLAEAHRHGVAIQGVYNTHGHIDHVGAVQASCDALSVPFFIHPEEAPVLASLPAQAQMFGLSETFVVPTHFEPLVDGQSIGVGALVAQVIHTPGHTPGGVCFLFDKDLFVGDSLFYGSIGRTDLPGGDGPQLLRSLTERLFVLDDEMRAHSGHGPSTTIGFERHHNPYLSPEARKWL